MYRWPPWPRPCSKADCEPGGDILITRLMGCGGAGVVTDGGPRNAASIIGLYPATKQENLDKFEEWREATAAKSGNQAFSGTK